MTISEDDLKRLEYIKDHSPTMSEKLLEKCLGEGITNFLLRIIDELRADSAKWERIPGKVDTWSDEDYIEVVRKAFQFLSDGNSGAACMVAMRLRERNKQLAELKGLLGIAYDSTLCTWATSEQRERIDQILQTEGGK